MEPVTEVIEDATEKSQKKCKSNKQSKQEDDIFVRAISSAEKHGIKILPGRKNMASGDCSYESVIFNINDRNCFKEKLNRSPTYYRKVWTEDMMMKTLNKTSSWNPGLSDQQIIEGFTEMMEPGVYERPFFGDMIMGGIACGVKKQILIFNTNADIGRFGHDPVAVVIPLSMEE